MIDLDCPVCGRWNENAESQTDALYAEIKRMREALKKAVPMLDDHFRWARDVQADSGVIMRAHDALTSARAALEPQS